MHPLLTMVIGVYSLKVQVQIGFELLILCNIIWIIHGCSVTFQSWLLRLLRYQYLNEEMEPSGMVIGDENLRITDSCQRQNEYDNCFPKSEMAPLSYKYEIHLTFYSFSRSFRRIDFFSLFWQKVAFLIQVQWLSLSLIYISDGLWPDWPSSVEVWWRKCWLMSEWNRV